MHVNLKTKENNERRMLANGGWKCSQCGRVNPGYIGSCGCGMSKSDNEAQKQELDNLKKIKNYKNLLDSGVISQEEFDSKKKQLLGL